MVFIFCFLCCSLWLFPTHAQTVEQTFSLSTKDAKKEFTLPEKLKETSGLIFWDKLIWTHNDDSDNNIYGINPESGEIVKTMNFPRLKVIDWEDLQHNKKYLYVGDFGNNYKGNRQNLRIFKIDKQTMKMDTIQFSYPEQKDFTEQKKQSTNFDCEAFIVSDSMLYLFTKEWSSNHTSLYKIPNKKGNHSASLISTFKTNGMITGATKSPFSDKIILTGYTKTISPFLLELTNYNSDNFLNGKVNKIKINQSFLQIEGVTFIGENKIAISNETIKQSFISKEAKLFIFEIPQ